MHLLVRYLQKGKRLDYSGFSPLFAWLFLSLSNMKNSKPKLKYKDGEYVCYLDLAMSFIRSKWKAVILCHVKDGSKRFSELHRALPGVSQKILNEQLKQLEKDGMLHKTVYPEVPPKVEFSLTERGKEIMPALDLLEQWARKQFQEEIKAEYKKQNGLN